MANIGAQLSRLFDGAKTAPIAKGIKDVFYVDDLFKNSQKKILSGIDEKATKDIDFMKASLDEITLDGEKVGGELSPELKKAYKDKMDKIDEVGLAGIKHKPTKEYLENRAKNGDDIKNLQEQAILNKAKGSVIGGKAGSTPSSLITDSARQVDGQVAFMTPVNAAMEYYGAPLNSAVSNIRASNWTGAAKDVGVAGARVGASALAVGGTAMVAKGSANAVRTGIDKMRGNNYER